MGDMIDEEKDVDKGRAPIVSIDGTNIKKIREAKKLTQLYVASVVGVTTDTISRWENNRYPTIRRDNAEKLASALEVDLAEILKKEAEAVPPEIKGEKGKRKLTALIAAVAAVIAVTLAILLPRLLMEQPSVVRALPKFASPGETIPVELTILRRDTGGKGLIIKERLPRGWRLFKADPPSAAGPVYGEEVKWLIPGGSGETRIRYTVQAPADAPLEQDAVFEGVAIIYDGEAGRAARTTGRTEITLNSHHWADANGDNRIDDSEIMPAYYLTEEMKGLGLDWAEIEAIWSSKGYRWDKTGRKFIVVR